MQTALSTDSNVADFMRQQGVPEAQIEQQIQGMPTYWGDQPNTAPYYAGAISIFLFVLAIILVDRKILAWSLPLILLGIMLSWGSNFSSFNYFMFDYFIRKQKHVVSSSGDSTGTNFFSEFIVLF